MKKRVFVFCLFLTLSVLLVSFLDGSGASRPAVLASGVDFSAYLPVAFNPAVDMEIVGIEATQSVQTAINMVPLVANRPTVLRVYARTVSGVPQSGVTLSITASRDGTPLGSINVGPQSVPKTSSRGDYSSSFNALLPASWLSGSVYMVVKVDSENVVLEGSEANNTMTASFFFNEVPALDVVVVPINYTHTGPTNPGYYPGQAVDYISDWIMRAYPLHQVNISFHAPYNFTGNLQSGTSWSFLLDAMYTLKLADGLPEDTPKVYYAFVPISNGAQRWFYGGIAGIGYIGYRESVGLNLGSSQDQSGTLAGHEIGHNFGRRHAPCGNPAGPDIFYPYPGASIGEYGLDIAKGILWSPTEAVDMMSYCDPQWVSDYTYRALYIDQMAHGFSVEGPAVDSINIRAHLAEDGSASFQPIYSFSAVPTARTGSSEYTIELLDVAGRILATHPAAVRQAGEEGVEVRTVHATLPLPAAQVASVRLLDAGRMVAERHMDTAASRRGTNIALSQRAGSITLRWGAVGIPAIVRYTVDDGDSRMTLGVDVREGELTVETANLPGGNGRFEVILADTLPSTVLTASLDASLPDAAPQVWITGETEVMAGRPAVLYGHGFDAEDGVLADLSWHVDGKVVGSGPMLSLHELPPGEHLVRLTVTDGAGQSRQVERVVTVLP